MDDDTQALTLADLIAFLRRYAMALVGAALVAGALAYVVSSFMEPTFEARSIVLAAQTNPEFRQFGMGIATAAPLDVSVYRAATLTPEVLEDARARAQAAGVEAVPSINALRRAATITTEARGTSSLMTIAVRDTDPLVATRLADAIARAAVAWDQQRARSALEELVSSLTMQIGVLDQQIAELSARADVSPDQIAGRVNLRAEQQEQLYYARVLAGSASGLLSVLQRAELPLGPVAPRPVLNAALAVVLAITLVLLVGLLRDLLDTRLRTVDQVTAVTNLPLLAAFPVLDQVRRAPMEAANFLRANLAFSLAQAHPKVIVATSASPGEGKTTVAVALATSFARQGYRTLLVDLDMRKPMVAEVFGLGRGDVRVDELLARHAVPLEALTVVLGQEAMLDVIPAYAGVDHPGERIATGIGSLLARAQDEEYDVIVLDTAPVMAVADTLPVAAIATATVVTVSLTESNRRQVANTLDVLRRAGATLAGTVVTHAPAGSRGEGGAYGYGYGYGYGAAQEARQAPAAKPEQTQPV